GGDGDGLEDDGGEGEEVGDEERDPEKEEAVEPTVRTAEVAAHTRQRHRRETEQLVGGRRQALADEPQQHSQRAGADRGRDSGGGARPGSAREAQRQQPEHAGKEEQQRTRASSRLSLDARREGNSELSKPACR